MYGSNHGVNRPNPATWMYEKLMRGETLHVVSDIYENPLYNIQCSQALWEILRRKTGGIVHLAGAETVNRHGFALKLASVFGLDKNLIVPVESSYFPEIAPRPRNTSFVTERMSRELGLKPLTVEQGLKLMKADMRVVA